MPPQGADVECGQEPLDHEVVPDLPKGIIMERNPRLNQWAQGLRKNLTKEEAKLWYQFLRLYRPRFHRQYVIGNYIADFYCHEAKLVVELDGSQHCSPEEKEYDQRRTEYLRSQGLTVMRLSNLDLSGRFRQVCEAIDLVVRKGRNGQ